MFLATIKRSRVILVRLDPIKICARSCTHACNHARSYIRSIRPFWSPSQVNQQLYTRWLPLDVQHNQYCDTTHTITCVLALHAQLVAILPILTLSSNAQLLKLLNCSSNKPILGHCNGLIKTDTWTKRYRDWLNHFWSLSNTCNF